MSTNLNLTLGDLGIVLALAGAVLGVLTLLGGIYFVDKKITKTAARLSWVILGGMALSFIAMERALITRDFGVLFVAQNGSHRTPALFNFSALWSALEGSILLWGFVLALFIAIMAVRFRNQLHDPLVKWALLVSYLVVIFFLILMLGPSDPFTRFNPPLGYDGPGPDPLLQDNLLVAFHPPILYLGLVGLTIPFCFAIASLITGSTTERWLTETRRWTLVAWGFLTVGIILGAWWSYDTLGWGGYWGWDPVENASLLPWLTATTFLHSALVQERRGMLKVWNLSLICATFSLTILGTFITRSGILVSVHSFTESSIGTFLLVFFAVVAISSLGLIAWRGERLRSVGSVDSPISREGTFLMNNVLFTAFALIVLLGTVFPLIYEAFKNDQISVGAPYFSRMIAPVGMTLLFLMAVAPALPWRKASKELMKKRLFLPAWAGTISVGLAVLLGARGVSPLIAFGLAGFAGGAAIRQLVIAVVKNGWRGFVGRVSGGMLVHLGVVLIAVALAASGSYLQQGEISLVEGASGQVAGHKITFVSFEEISHPERLEQRLTVKVDGDTLTPSINRYIIRGRLVGDPDTSSSLFQIRDVQVAVVGLPAESDEGVAVFRVTSQPLINWLWLGGLIMALGTLLALFPALANRARIGKRESSKVETDQKKYQKKTAKSV